MENIALDKQVNNSVVINDRIIQSGCAFALRESFNRIRTNLMLALPTDGKAKIIGITGSVPGEGKNTSCINLAIVFAKTGVRVALVDCDLRKPSIHEYLKIERENGISELVEGSVSLDKAIKQTEYENLSVITAGVHTDNPSETLVSKAFNDLVHELENKFDYIFIDLPPVNTVTDATVVSRLLTGMVLVTKRKVSKFNKIDQAIKILDNANVKVLGFIFNDSHKAKGLEAKQAYQE